MACDFALPPRIKLDHASTAPAANSSGDSKSAPTGATGKKGQPWTEAEHLGFLAGLKKLGKGNWRGISRLFVPSRTPTQVASHAQKHFLRLSGVTKRRSRFSTLDQAAGAQNILEAAAHAGRATQSSQEWDTAYSAAVASRQADLATAEGQQLPTAPCPEFAWRAMPAYLGVGRGTMISQTEQSEPFQFTKICRPTAYRASARNGEVQKLVRLVAAAAAVAPQCNASAGRLQHSSHSAFKTLKPQQSVRV